MGRRNAFSRRGAGWSDQLGSLLGPRIPHVGGLSDCLNTSQISMEVNRKHLLQPQRLLERLTAIKKLVSAAKVTGHKAKDWLKKYAIWQFYLPAPRHIT